MKIFISYSSKYRDLVERLRLALVAEGHEPFVDRAELEPGQPFDAELREAIDECDLLVYLLSPESVAAGSYALAELALAQTRWPHPRGRVLPVKLAPTPLDAVPPYLKAVTMYEPQGDPVPGIVAAIARLSPARRRLAWIATGTIGVLLALAAAWFWQQRVSAQDAQRDVERRAIASAAELCTSGGYAAGWQRLVELASQKLAPSELQAAREDCAMQWLRDVRVRGDNETFSDVVKQLVPTLVAGLVTASPTRAADLRAHLGWGENLRSRDGAADANPDAHFSRALQDDPRNVYANSMRAHYLAVRNREFEALAHFRTAVEAQRDLEFVRRMQVGAWLWRAGYSAHLVTMANEMRINGETVTPEQRRALWNPLYFTGVFNTDDNTKFLALLPAADHLATFDWLYPKPRDDSETGVWRYCRAILQANTGQRDAARNELEALHTQLVANKQPGRLLDQTQRALKRLAAPGSTSGASRAPRTASSWPSPS